MRVIFDRRLCFGSSDFSESFSVVWAFSLDDDGVIALIFSAREPLSGRSSGSVGFLFSGSSGLELGTGGSGVL